MEFRSKVRYGYLCHHGRWFIDNYRIFSEPSVFADKCDKNEDNNCNETDVNQKIGTDNKCKIDNLSNDHSNENFDDNLLGMHKHCNKFKEPCDNT